MTCVITGKNGVDIQRPGGTTMQTKITQFCCLVVALVAMVGTAHATNWEVCGTIRDINPNSCQIASRPATQFEYGIAYITAEPVPVVCTFWNVGARIANKTPLFVDSDNPSLGMRYGGFVFYNGTAAADDDLCTQAGGYTHQYWYLTTNNNVNAAGIFSNGCFFNLPIYCRGQ
jgi:hypothetical protein